MSERGRREERQHRILMNDGVATNLAALSEDTYVDYGRYFGGLEDDEPARESPATSEG